MFISFQLSLFRGRKRPPSAIDYQEDNSMESYSSGKLKTEDLVMDDCAAAMVLMSLSCSPKSPMLFKGGNASNDTSRNMFSFESASHDSGVYSSASPSPPQFKLSLPDEQDAPFDLSSKSSVVEKFIESAISSRARQTDNFLRRSLLTPPSSPIKHLLPVINSKTKRKKIVYRCTWPGCDMKYRQNSAIERHVRTVHLGPGEVEENEEEFYYTEMEVSEQEALLDESSGSEGSSSPGPVGAEAPTWSHLDMARPPTEDPEYLEQLRQKQQPMIVHLSSPINIPFLASSNHILHRNKVMRVESKSLLASPASSLSSSSSSKRRGRGETRKCRKVYGMEARDLWCTQCKWKKACTRFTD